MNRDKVYVQHILTNIAHIQRLESLGESAFVGNSDHQAALLYYLQTLAESAGRLSEEVRLSQPAIPWQQIKGFRNRVAHDYLSIDLRLVWGIVTNEIPALKTAAEAILKMIDDHDED